LNASIASRRDSPETKRIALAIGLLILAAAAFCRAASAQTVAAPVGHPDSYDVTVNIVRIVDAPGVLANDETVKGRDGRGRSDLRAQLIADVGNGALMLNPDGSFVYSPAPDFAGSDEFTYIASDGVASTAETLVTLNVSAAQPAVPIAMDDAYSVMQGIVLEVAAPGILENDLKVTGKEGRGRQALSARLVTATAHGELALGGDGSFAFTPDPDFIGIDSFTYDIYDGVARSDPATVTVTVDGNAGNAAPVVAAGADQIVEAGTMVVLDGTVTDDGLPLDPGLVVTAWSVTGGPGSVSFADAAAVDTTAGFTGDGIYVLRLTASDGELVAFDEITVTVNPAPAPNAAPVVVSDSYVVSQGTSLVIEAPGLLANDSDPDGDALTAILQTGASNGALQFGSDGSFVYVPQAGFVGDDGFSYRATDGSLESDTASVSLQVVGGEPAPEAVPDAYESTGQSLMSVSAPGVLKNDRRVTGPAGKDREPLTAGLVETTAYGDLTLGADGSFAYLPQPGFAGVDSFRYQAFDGTSLSNVASVTITVSSSNRPPTISGTPITLITPNEFYEFIPTANDPDGDLVSFTVSKLPSWATFDAVTGAITGIPTTDDVGIHGPISIIASDGDAEAWLEFFEIAVAVRSGLNLLIGWQPPALNENGSELVDLSGYRIRVWDGTTFPHEFQSLQVDVQDPAAATYSLDLPWQGVWRIAMTAYNTSGTESRLSEIIPVIVE